MHCWCPPATGPNQPHEKDCSHYKQPSIADPSPDPSINKIYIPVPTPKFRPVKSPFFGHGFQAQTYAAAMEWLDRYDVKPLVATSLVRPVRPIECTCAAKSGVVGHAAFCPLGDDTQECQAWFGADDICGLPANSPVHYDARSNALGHRFLSKAEKAAILATVKI
jgi:hypothetical protein